MSRPGIDPGPPAWEASTLEKSHLDSLFAGYSEPLLGLRWRSARGLYSTVYTVLVWDRREELKILEFNKASLDASR
jgi:hypothetical protein